MANIVIDSMMEQALIEARRYEKSAGCIEGKYFGAISSFGTSIVGSGIRSTLLFYGAKGDKFTNFESSILNILNAYLVNEPVENLYFYENNKLTLNAVIALKLAIRTYDKIEQGD